VYFYQTILTILYTIDRTDLKKAGVVPMKKVHIIGKSLFTMILLIAAVPSVVKASKAEIGNVYERTNKFSILETKKNDPWSRFNKYLTQREAAVAKLLKGQNIALKATTGQEYLRLLRPHAIRAYQTHLALGKSLLNQKWPASISSEIEELAIIEIQMAEGVRIAISKKTYEEYVASVNEQSSLIPGNRQVLTETIKGKLGH
jgi:hypothetical protein